MRILVIDDKPVNLAAATAQLHSHEVTTKDNYGEGLISLCPGHDFEVVLTDLLMPVVDNLGLSEKGDRWVGQEIPFGFLVALHALMMGVRWVGILTIENHHDHPASMSLDRYRYRGGFAQNTTIGESELIMANDSFVGYCHPDKPGVFVNWEPGITPVKNWAEFLEYLLLPHPKVGYWEWHRDKE